MGNDVGGSTMVGFIRPDHRILEIWEDESSYTQAGPRAGDPVADQDPGLNLQASGSQTEEVLVATQRSGIPVGQQSGCGIRWRYDTTEDWRGSTVPHSLEGWEALEWTTAGGTEEPSKHPSIVTTDDGVVICAYDYDDLVLGSGVKVQARDPGAGTWISTFLPVGGTIDHCPSLVLLSSGRVLLVYAVSSSGNTQMISQYSDDDGATWDVDNEGVLEQDIGSSNTLLETAACWYKGSICLLGLVDTGGSAYELWQWASADRGSTFREIAQLGSHSLETSLSVGAYTSSGFFAVACYSTDTGIIVAAADEVTTATGYQRLSTIRIGSTSQSIETTTWLDTEFCYLCESVAMAGEGGRVYLYWSAPPQGAVGPSVVVCGVALSNDDGESWTITGGSPGTAAFTPHACWWSIGAAATYPEDIAVTIQRGRAMLAHRWVTAPGTNDNSLGVARLGCSSTVTMPALGDYQSSLQTSWAYTLLPLELPNNMGWALTGAGTATLTAGDLNLVTAANSIYYDVNPTGTILEGLLVRATVVVTTGTVLSGGNIRMRLADGTDDYDISLVLGRLGARLIDNNAGGATVGSDSGYAAGSRVEYLIAFTGARVRIWYRIYDGLEADKEWTLHWTSNAITNDNTTPAANNLIRWGNSVASTVDTSWSELHYASDEYTGAQLTAATFPDNLWPREITQVPVYIAGGLYLSASDGKTVVDDSWTCSPAYDYAADRILPAVQESPRNGWRSVADGSLMTIAFETEAATSPLETDVLGVALLGTNLEEVVVQGNSGTTALPVWADLMTLKSADGADALGWTRDQRVVSGTAAGSTKPYILRGDYDGGSFTDGIKVIGVDRHTEGRLALGDARRALVFLEEIGGLAASGATGKLMAPRMAGLLKLNGSKYAGFRLKIPSQTTKDGDYRIGTAVIGPVIIPGYHWAWGSALTTASRVSINTRADGTRSAHKDGPESRVLEVSWIDGAPTSQAFNSEEPDYITAMSNISALPVASLADSPFLLEGLYRQLDGQRTPVVAIRRIDYSGTELLFTSRQEMLYGYLDGEIRLENIQGEEVNCEMLRVPTVTIRELV